MAYEVFKRTGVRVEAPVLAITSDGRIAANAAAVRILKAANVRSVLLLWDKEKHRLAIKATQKGDKNAYIVSITPDNHSGGIRAKSFLGYIGWNAGQRETFPATWNEDEKMLEVELPLQYLESKKSGKTKQKA